MGNDKQRRWLSCKGVTFWHMCYKEEKTKIKNISGQEKLKISPYLSVFGRSLQKKVYSILTKLGRGRQIQALTVSGL